MHHIIDLAAILALTLSLTTTASAINPASPGYGFKYQVCTTDVPSARALTSNVTYYDTTGMTVQKCASACQGYYFFGVEAGTQCFCGNTINPGIAIASASSCNQPCAGNSTEYCGATNYLSLYSQSSNSSLGYDAFLSPSACWVDPIFINGIRSLGGAVYIDNALTVEKCAAECVGYGFFGVEYANQCFCGNSLGAGTVTALASDCKYQCPGNNAETCGAAVRINIYKYK